MLDTESSYKWWEVVRGGWDGKSGGKKGGGNSHAPEVVRKGEVVISGIKVVV